VAKRDSNFALFAPWLQQNIDLDRRLAESVGYAEHPFDALIEANDPGVTTVSMRAIFAALRPQLIDLVRRIARDAGAVDESPLYRRFDEATQEQLCRDVAARIGYDFSRGCLDRTVHPFMTSLGRDDARITTRYDEHFLSAGLLGAVHETGHALYEQGLDPSLDRTTLDYNLSPGVHESQSRLWENFVGRGLPFWQYYYPTVQAAFPAVLADVDVAAFHRAINCVRPSFIRIEADEVTYSLHVMLRFELEVALFEGEISVADAPEAWNAAMREYLGITPPSDREGILQDVHWTDGFGQFQGYALGNIIAAQLWETVNRVHRDLPDLIRSGRFSPLLDWLRANIHRHGRKFDSADLVRRATGASLSTEPYIRYLREKFSAIYALT
jgi:carboxypeptidase Taq